ncbi:MAG: hypothetical protein K6G87_10395 [Butyrivibrio sp.]|uniref:hypothetical protein n=1 Tax=Butyrivibrio sp. TaxID=28121 RepID=UPI0025FC1DCD|nr:hypothetical protein [Butyrivibrio sp.]MCR5771625.1 hypothetical protein [Butyrivibrio sp.]
MQDILLLLVIIPFFILGFYVMKKIDLFMTENENNIEEERINQIYEKNDLRKCSGEDITHNETRA